MSIFSINDRWLAALWLSLWLLLTGALLQTASWQADNELRERMHVFEKQTLDLSEIAEQIVVARMQHYDEVLLVLRDAFVADRKSFPEMIKRQRSGPLADPELLVVLIDRDGYLTDTNTPNLPARLYLGDRTYFRFFANGGKDRLYIDEPSFGRVTRRYALPLARPIFDKGGSFLGVVAISIKPEALSNFGHALVRTSDTTITVATTSGAIVTHSHDVAHVQGTKLSPEQLAPMLHGDDGVFTAPAEADDSARTIAYQRPADLPLLIFAEAYPRDLLRETSQERTLILWSAGSVAALFLVVLLGLLLRRKVMAKYIATQHMHLLEAQRIAGMGSWELDLASLHFKWSDEVYRLFGVSAATFDPSLKNFLQLVVETDRAAVSAEIEKAISAGQGSIEFSLMRGDGQQRRMIGRGEVLRDHADRATTLLGTIRDITEQRDAEHALMESEEKLRAIADNVSTVMFMKDLDGRYLFVNRQYEQLFHLSNAEIQGKTDHDIFPHEMADSFIRNDQRVIQSGQPLEVEEMVPHDDGMHFYISSKFPLRHATGEIYAVCGVAVDITERKRAEQMAYRLILRNQVLMQNAQDGIHILDHQGQIQEANLAFCSLLGYSPAEIQRLNVADWEAQMSASELKKALTTLLDGGKAQFETVNRRKDGSLVDVEVSAVGVELDGEKFIYAATRDISERKRSQQELEVLVQQRTAELSLALQAAQVADQTKDAFLANITHELRTPLSAVIGFSGLARPFCTDPRQRDYLDKINSASKTLSGIINDLLDLSKIAAGRMELETCTFSLRQLLSRSRSVMSYKAEEKGLELIELIADEVPDVLCGDTLRIEQILLNLLSNAIKFTSSGRVELRVSLATRTDERICIAIDVEDTGIGLSDEATALLFKPFTQSDASMSRKFGGTGLGLAICKHLTEMMGGEISVSSHEGRGTTFRITLWLAPGDAAELAATERPGDQAMLPTAYLDARVLVVDDQLFNREVVEGLLAVVGITPDMASNGQEALDLLASAGPAAFDLVLMDIQMPLLDGLSATRIIRSMEGFDRLPIIAMTAHTMTHEKVIGNAAGMNDHIGKPFHDTDFYRVLAKWLPPEKHGNHPAAVVHPAPSAAGKLPPLRGIDTHAGLALFVGDEARYRHWLINFVEEAPGYVEQIRQSLASGQPEQGGSAAHILKGRAGMLGMSELHNIAAALETAIDANASADALQENLVRLDLLASQLCTEISRAFGLTGAAAPVSAPLPAPLPDGPVPPAIKQLIARLEAGDGDCDLFIINCQEELGNTAWAPRLEQAQVLVRNFDFNAARKLFCIE